MRLNKTTRAILEGLINAQTNFQVAGLLKIDKRLREAKKHLIKTTKSIINQLLLWSNTIMLILSILKMAGF